MNTKLKQTGVMGITSLLILASIATIPGFIGEAEAKVFKPQYVVLPEPEPDVELSVKQISERVDVSQKINHLKIKSDSNTETFKVGFIIVNDGTTDVRKVTVSVQSDTETIEGEFSVNLDKPKYSTINVLIKAADPTSINAVITGYQIS